MSDFSKKEIYKSDINIEISNKTIRQKSNGFVLCSFDSEQVIIAIEEINFLKPNVSSIDKFNYLSKECFNENELSKSINFIIYVDYYSFVPKIYFEQRNIHLYFPHAIKQSNQADFDYVFSEISHDIVCVCAIDKHLKELIVKSFPKASIKTDIEILSRLCINDFVKKINDKKSFLYLNFLQNNCDIIEFVDGKLFIANRFSYNSIENFIYHILNILHQSNQFTDQTEIILIGDIQLQSAIVIGLSRYFNKITLLPNDVSKLPKEIEHNYSIETVVQ